MSISNRLREVMEYKGLSIKAFAELLDMPYRTLQNYLLNERDPSAEVLIKISDVLNVNLNWLMRGKGVARPAAPVSAGATVNTTK